MKTLITIVLLAVTFFAGNTKGLYQHEQSSEKLTLNNGAKWKVDKPTRNNVAGLRQIIKVTDNKATKTLKDYRRAGLALQAGINKMIGECRMKGPDHLALHQWLEPLMEKVAGINQASGKAAAAHSFNAVKTQFNFFDRYFQF